MRNFLFHINTKQRLTIYLGRYLLNALITRGKRFVISFNTLTVSNMPEVDGRLNANTQEEDDTLMILYAIFVAHVSPFLHFCIILPDTDVLLLLKTTPLSYQFWFCLNLVVTRSILVRDMTF